MRLFQALLISFGLSLAMLPRAQADYACDNADQAKGRANGVAQCVCFGTDNCGEMKKSDSCKSSVNCSSAGSTITSCSCDAKAKILGTSIKAKQPVGKSQK